MIAAVLLALASLVFQPVLPDTTAQSPWVYVQEANAPAAPAGDAAPHDAGLREPRASDPDTAQLDAGDGHALQVLLGTWRTAVGTADVTRRDDGTTRFRGEFHGLVPNAHYSVFVRQVAGRSVALTPIDLVGATDSFVASAAGDGAIVTSYPGTIPSNAQIVLLYHSDGTDHGSSIGDPYRNVHAQLILRVP